MVKKKILYTEEARMALLRGMGILVKAVSLTLGPKGKNVILHSNLDKPQIVNDGITIAKEIELDNPYQNTGVALIRQSAIKTNEVAGDGTTTATAIAYAIVAEGLKYVSIGYNPILLKIGIEKAASFVVDKIAEYSRPINDIKDIINVASVSSGNNFQVASLIAQAIKKVGREGIITLKEGNSTQSCLEFTGGMEFDRGFISSYFVTGKINNRIIQVNPLILLTDRKISLLEEELIPLLEEVAALKRSILIIAEDIDKASLATLIINKVKGFVDVVVVRTPGFGENRKFFLDDIAILTGATVISSDVGLTLNNLRQLSRRLCEAGPMDGQTGKNSRDCHHRPDTAYP